MRLLTVILLLGMFGMESYAMEESSIIEETAAEMESEAAWQQEKEAEDAESFLKAFFSLKPLPEEAADQKNESTTEAKESSAEADNDSAEAEAESTEASSGAADAEEKHTETDGENAAIDVDEIMQNYVEYYTAYYEEAQLTPYLSEKGFDTLVSKRMPQKYQKLMEEGTVLVEDVKLLDCEARLFVGGNLYTYEVDLRLDGKEAIVCVDGQLMMDADGKVEDLYVNETEEFLTLLSGAQQEFAESAAETESE